MSEVGIAQLRRDLMAWLARAREGDEIVITDRGKPVARLIGIDVPATLERLIADRHVNSQEDVVLRRALCLASGAEAVCPSTSSLSVMPPSLIAYFDSSALVKLVIAGRQ